MKRNGTIVMLAVAGLFGGMIGGAFAPRLVSAAPGGPLKIAYVDLQKTLSSTKVGKTAVGKLEKEKTDKQAQVNAKKEELKLAAADLEKQRVVLKPEAVAKREKELEGKYVELQQTFVQLQQDLSKKEAALTRDLFIKAAVHIETIAKRDGYALVLEKNESAVLYGDRALDITDEVNKLLDASPAK
jgi:outer membrane protein